MGHSEPPAIYTHTARLSAVQRSSVEQSEQATHSRVSRSVEHAASRPQHHHHCRPLPALTAVCHGTRPLSMPPSQPVISMPALAPSARMHRVVYACTAVGLTHYAVPGGVVLLVELLLDVRRHVSLDAILGQWRVVATSTASCCISSLMSAFLITARRRSDMARAGRGEKGQGKERTTGSHVDERSIDGSRGEVTSERVKERSEVCKCGM